MDDLVQHASRLMPHTSGGVFVTGTDTGVGKTLVTAALATALRQQGLSIGVMKPVETGVAADGQGSDAARLQLAAGTTDAAYLVAPYSLSAPLAPLAAAQATGLEIDARRIEQAYRTLSGRHGYMLVEGIGGVRVPIGEKFDVLDLIQQLDLPVVVVGRSALGGVNHALLTLEALERRATRVIALVLNPTGPGETVGHAQTDSTVALLQQAASCCVLGPLPYVPPAHGWTRQVSVMAQDCQIIRLANLLTASEAP
jgi:dethiobiotin synthetase